MYPKRHTKAPRATNKGPSPELMPSIMGAFDAFIEHNKSPSGSTPVRRTLQNNHFNLSPGVQKMLSNVPDGELSRFGSEETLKRTGLRGSSTSLRAFRTPERTTEVLDLSPHVQKMISNFPDAELVILGGERTKPLRNGSFVVANGNDGDGGVKTFLYHSDCSEWREDRKCEVRDNCDDNSGKNGDNNCNYSPRPLGSYLHTYSGIASRTPAGRKNMGKYLQVPSESTNSTVSSEVSRPVSLTSLGSCSSSSSGGPHQPSSAYLASAESLDSDPEPTGSQGSADSGIAEQSIMSPEARVLQEVLDTETVYVSDLNEVIQGYLTPWREDPECPFAQHLSCLFTNLEEIYRFNKGFLEQLREADCNPSRIANVFIQNDSGFGVYNEYCTRYPRTMEVLGELTRDPSTVLLIREKQMALKHALPLGSYLLKPVQRILKYHLLLQRLSKQCEPLHKPAVDLALTTMTAVASGINTMKRKHEHSVRVHEIQSQLYGWEGPDLTTLGELIAEGTFRVNGARGRRHVFLFDKVLLMAKNKQDGALAYKSHIECSNLMLVEQVRGENLSFQVLPFDNPRLQCTLRARSPQHKREWTLQIKRVILENYSAVIPNHARQLVLQLGQEVQETEDNADKWSPLNKYSTPHYLERRSRVRKSANFSNRRTSSQDRSFPSLGNWRRKSEPSMALIPQYNTKTIPKKISKLRKAKEGGGAVFYTDLSDSENCDVIGESNESLEETNTSLDVSGEEEKTTSPAGEVPNLEKIVSDLLMQHEEYQKIFNRPRKNARGSEPEAATWFEGRAQLPSKADSLPRSFQLNDQIGENVANAEVLQKESLKEIRDDEEQHQSDLSSQLDDNEYPVHKIYRKSAIRFSILQRFRALVSEEQRGSKYPLRKQGSKSMGEKIAHPDYVDPQKLFASSCSTVDLAECEAEEPERPDMSLNEHEVLSEFDKRLNGNVAEARSGSVNSSQNSDSYYERMLEKELVEEYTQDADGKLVAKQDSFRGSENTFYVQKYNVPEVNGNERKRPTKPPPPIPTKPSRLVARSEKKVVTTTNNINKLIHSANLDNKVENSWVKAMVGRFE